MSEKYKDDILEDSYYLISLFNKDNRKVTNLQIQKLMYFFEAYYMVEKDVDSLYECNFNAWAYGPVAIPIYKEFKEFRNDDIKLTDEQKEKGDSIDKEKKNYLEYIYRIFGGLNVFDLVKLTHIQGSPWYDTWIKNNSKVVAGEDAYIDKLQTKNWFKENFIQS